MDMDGEIAKMTGSLATRFQTSAMGIGQQGYLLIPLLHRMEYIR